MKKIGELAKKYQLKTDTLRYYEKNQLLVPNARLANGYRYYTEQDELTLRFILKAKNVGFSLQEIGELLEIERNKSNWACADVKQIVETKIEVLTQKIDQLAKFQASLQSLADACCGGSESAHYCSILENLEASV